MSYKSHNGLTECTTFADFYIHMTGPNSNKNCPRCGHDMDVRLYPTFNMNKYGRAEFRCINDKCPQFKEVIKIEAVGGNLNGLERIRKRR